jgi:hypothetical protein
MVTRFQQRAKENLYIKPDLAQSRKATEEHKGKGKGLVLGLGQNPQSF